MADHADREVDCDTQQEPDQAAPAEIARVVERENVVVSILDRLRQPIKAEWFIQKEKVNNQQSSFRKSPFPVSAQKERAKHFSQEKSWWIQGSLDRHYL